MNPNEEVKELLTPRETLLAAAASANVKLDLSGRKLAVSAFLAGVYIAMGGMLSVLIGYGFPGIAEANPGLQRLLSGAMFPLGLILVVFLGADLFTGNNAVLMPGVLDKKYGWGSVLKNWSFVWLGNLRVRCSLPSFLFT